MVILAISVRAAKLLHKVLGKADEDDQVLEEIRKEIQDQCLSN